MCGMLPGRVCAFFPVADPEERPGVPVSPLIFRPKWGPKGRKKVFWRPGPPLISGSGWPAPPPPPSLSEGLDQSLFPMIEKAFLQKRRTCSEGCRDTLPYGETLCQVEGSLAYMPELPWASKRSLHFLTKLGDRAVYIRNKKLARQGHLLAGITLLHIQWNLDITNLCITKSCLAINLPQ